METSQHTLSFARVSGKKVEADFDGGCTTQDGGLLLLRKAEARTGVLKRMVAALPDRRHPSYIDHTCEDLLRQRVFQIACGCEDANDSDALRCDPGLKAACERAPLMEQALAQAEERAKEEPVRLFTSFDYQAKSWKHPQRILYKAEVTQGKANPRFVTTTIPDRTPKFLYEKVYCARGRAEGFIKNHKTFLHSDRTSCHRFAANQFRLFLHSAAYVLMHALQQIGLQGTPWATATFDTIRLRVLQVGARVRERARSIRFHFATSYPLQDVWRTILFNFDSS